MHVVPSLAGLAQEENPLQPRPATSGAVRAVWITWERHRRTREITRALDLRLFEFLPAISGSRKYAGLIARTTLCLLQQRPTHVFAQCPSVVLAVWLAILKRVAGYYLVIDLHNAAVQPAGGQANWHRWLIRRIHRSADLCLITNEGLRQIVESHGGNVFVLPDRVPQLRSRDCSTTDSSNPLVVYVCSFANDEPYLEVFEAASRLAGIATICVTGDASSASVSHDLPPNVQLTGFLDHEGYEMLLWKADVVVDLTTREDCLLCGAYEAIAAGKPLVTSDTRALRALLGRAAVFTKHDPASIANAVQAALQRRSELALLVRRLRPELDQAWDRRAATLVGGLGIPHGTSAHVA